MHRRGTYWMVAAVLTALAAAGCRRAEQPAADVAASNSLLQCAVADLMGDQTPVLRLAEPGMCPGHFDVRPSQVAALRRCRLLLRLDFQRSLDAKLAGAVDAGLHIAEVSLPGGLCEPDSYLAACRQTAAALTDAGLLDGAAAERRLERIAERIAGRVKRWRAAVAPLAGRPVAASTHQEKFCRWLGLHVVATFRGADVESTTRLDEARRLAAAEKVGLIVANRPEGRRAADFLARGLDAAVVVFDNFPTDGGADGFEAMLDGNIAALLKASDR